LSNLLALGILRTSSRLPSLNRSFQANAIPLFTSTVVVQALESKNPGCYHNLKNLFLCYNKKEKENVF